MNSQLLSAKLTKTLMAVSFAAILSQASQAADPAHVKDLHDAN